MHRKTGFQGGTFFAVSIVLCSVLFISIHFYDEPKPTGAGPFEGYGQGKENLFSLN